jgi:hypothetical protein
VLSALEAREVGANLGHEHLRRAAGDTGDGLEERDGLVLSGSARFKLGVHTRTGRIQVLEVGQLLARAGKMWWASTRPTTAWASASRLALSLWARQLGHCLCIGLAVSPSSSRCSISRAQEPAHVGDDGSELDVGVRLRARPAAGW